MLLEDYLSGVVKKHSLNLMILSDVLHLRKLIIFTHFPNILTFIPFDAAAKNNVLLCH